MKHILVALLVTIFAIPAYAHEGEDHAVAPGTEGESQTADIIELTDTAIHNLGVITAKAEISPRAETVSVNGIIELMPEKQAIVTTLANGHVAEIYAKIGDEVKKGQVLLAVQPSFVGNPPVRISSPISGVLLKQNIVIGQSVTPETSLMEVGDSSEMLVRGVLYETPDVTRIRVGQSAQVTGGLLANTVLNGKVQRMDRAFDSGSRTFNVYVAIENPDRLLLANMQVVLSINAGEAADVLTVPAKAILGENGDNFVFVRTGNSFERRKVKLGSKFGADREILEGVFPDEDVVTVGNYQLQFAKTSVPAKREHKD